MLELLAHIPGAPVVYVRFLNLELQRNFDEGETPQTFVERCRYKLEHEFRRLASGGTRALEAIQDSIARYDNDDKAVLRYFLGDGLPNGEFACREIAQLLTDRPHPERNPFTFLSCTGNDKDVRVDERVRGSGSVTVLCRVGRLRRRFGSHKRERPFTQTRCQTCWDISFHRKNTITISSVSWKPSRPCCAATKKRRRRIHTAHQQCLVKELLSLYSEFVGAARAADIPAVAEYSNEFKENSI